MGGNVADFIRLSHSGPITWNATYSPSLNLGAGLGADVMVYIDVPSGAPLGSTGVVTITATSQGDTSKSAAAVLTTQVGGHYIYLPLVMRDYSSS